MRRRIPKKRGRYDGKRKKGMTEVEGGGGKAKEENQTHREGKWEKKGGNE